MLHNIEHIAKIASKIMEQIFFLNLCLILINIQA